MDLAELEKCLLFGVCFGKIEVFIEAAFESNDLEKAFEMADVLWIDAAAAFPGYALNL